MKATRLFAALSVTLSAAASFAAENAHHEGGAHGHGGIPWDTILYSTINLLIFAWVMARFAVPSIRGWVRERRDLVVRDLEAAAAARGEAQRLKSEWEARLNQLEGEIETMRAQARKDIEHERERVLAAARASAEAMLRDAQRLAAAEARQLEAQLRAEVAHKAIALAEEKIRAQWSAADQERSVADFLRQLPA